MGTVAKSPMTLAEITKLMKHANNNSVRLNQAYL
jgi:hypothetical protein